MKSYHVKFWALRPGKAKTKRTYEVRWKVGHAPHSRTLGNKAHAENFLSDLRQAARAGEPFDVATGLPASMMTARSRSWFAFCLAYMDMKWPAAAPKTRESLTDALATIIPAVTDERLPDWLEPAFLRRALRQFALAPGSRDLERRAEVASALRWLEKSSLPVAEVGKPAHARAVLDAICLRLDGRAAGATTIARKRWVFVNVLRYAVEVEELPFNPLDRLSWKPPKVSEIVDRRVVVNPRQARELLTAVTYVGQRGGGRYSRGQRLTALYACMYFAALRPGEAVALRRQDCELPASGWGPPGPGKVAARGHPALERHRFRPRGTRTQAPARQRYPPRSDPARAGRHPAGAHRDIRGRARWTAVQQRTRPGRRFHRAERCVGRNLGRLSRRFYRPLPLATRATCQKVRRIGRHSAG